MSVIAERKKPVELTVEDYQLQAQLVRALYEAGPANALGAAFSYLLLASETEGMRPVLRTLLNERVIRNGLSGDNMINTLTRVARS